MKKFIFILATVIMCMAFTIALADNNHGIIDQRFFFNAEIQENAQPSFTLPASLQIIGEEAFEGTALTGVQLPETVMTIEDRAFANIRNLRYIYIPEKTTYIGKDVLAGTRTVIIAGFSGSYAGTWAKSNGIPFAPLTVFTADNTIPQISGLISGKTLRKELNSNEKTDEQYDSTPKGRTEGEIKAAKHEKCFTHGIQGRSPPMNG